MINFNIYVLMINFMPFPILHRAYFPRTKSGFSCVVAINEAEGDDHRFSNKREGEEKGIKLKTRGEKAATSADDECVVGRERRGARLQANYTELTQRIVCNKD